MTFIQAFLVHCACLKISTSFFFLFQILHIAFYYQLFHRRMPCLAFQVFFLQAEWRIIVI